MQIRIHNEGWIFFISSIVISIILMPFIFFLSIFFLLISAYIFYFFRDPVRIIPTNDFIVSPADGVITYIGKEEPPIKTLNNNKYIKISIFLNIFNVHVNRIPCNGLIKNIKYYKGKFLNASLDKSSQYNEKNILSLEKENGESIFIVQIAGLIARRIVCDIKENQSVLQGSKFGIIKFGSRVDLYMPDHYKPLVAVGQTLLAGETIIANPNDIKEITNGIRI